MLPFTGCLGYGVTKTTFPTILECSRNTLIMKFNYNWYLLSLCFLPSILHMQIVNYFNKSLKEIQLSLFHMGNTRTQGHHISLGWAAAMMNPEFKTWSPDWGAHTLIRTSLHSMHTFIYSCMDKHGGWADKRLWTHSPSYTYYFM